MTESHDTHEVPESESSFRERITALVDDWLEWAEQQEKHPCEPEPEEEEKGCPDLLSLYTELSATRHAVSSGLRRVYGGIKDLGGRLEGLDERLRRAGTTSDQRPVSPDSTGDFSSSRLPLALAELYTRMERMRARLTTPPRGGLLTGDWKRQWGSLHEGMDILSSHFRDLLAEAGVSRIQSEGKAFDPSCMMAVATKEHDDLPDGTVVEEVTPGYRHDERVVKYAEVTVVRNRREG